MMKNELYFNDGYSFFDNDNSLLTKKETEEISDYVSQKVAEEIKRQLDKLFASSNTE